MRGIRPGAAALALAVLLPFAAAPWKVEPPFSDDALFEYYGRAIAHGSRLYVDLWDNKLPGVYLVNAALQALFDARYVVHAVVQAAFDAASVLLFAFILRRNGLALWAPAALAFSAFVSVLPPSFNTVENFALPFQLLAVALWSVGRRVAAGAALAIAATFWIPGAVLLVAMLAAERGTKPRVLVAAGFAGALIVYAAAILAWFGVREIADLVRSWGPYAASNAGGRTQTGGRLGAVSAAYHGLVGSGLGILLALLAAVARKPTTQLQRFALLWLACALVAASAPGSFYSHYFIPAIPPCILAIAAFGTGHRVTVRQAAFGVLALFFVVQTTRSAVRDTSSTRMYADEQAAIGERVRAIAGARAVVTIDDYAPAIYLTADAAGEDAASLVPHGLHPSAPNPATRPVLLVHSESAAPFAVPRGAVACGRFGAWSLYALSAAAAQVRARCVASPQPNARAIRSN
ncbi:MAG: hypothetical protein JWO85_1178 [Candidatus Eremiobacteraeota bacterium]|nr:hypothetical protein [Candidatus Eremiobacteraeota bacterium]